MRKTKQHVIDSQLMIIQELRATADINRDELVSATRALKDQNKEVGVLHGQLKSAESAINNCAIHLETGIELLYPGLLNQQKRYDPTEFERKILVMLGEDDIPPPPIERFLLLLNEKLRWGGSPSESLDDCYNYSGRDEKFRG